MPMQNFGVTNKEHYGMLWYFLEWSIVVVVVIGHHQIIVLLLLLFLIWPEQLEKYRTISITHHYLS